MEYERIDGPDGLVIRVPIDDGYPTCSQCGGDCEPDPGAGGGIGTRIEFISPIHGVNAAVDPSEDQR
ncbi:hypothetical protein [Brachybacterium paraconglomeratum]|uniref:hypothetical protein n=1 Tax=Brachybacterium paraconglomeratum TaxID=173362 RepID=UPI002491275B|nr:hypothetical protein [Brachybacterium paraconglomeratum]